MLVTIMMLYTSTHHTKNIDWNAFQITYYELQPLIDIIINYFK
ncbi:hypothetical protein PG1791B_1406 [Bifidobacterium pseudolongum subsp. globosum]|nr:hypothetical protein PG1791B_1406 [Bifidobacterium pseudolongum subsp. globosum]